MINTSKMLAAAAAAALAVLPAAATAKSGNQGNLVAAAMKSKDHETLVAAVKAAGLVDTLASGGPFTVFAPTDAAFAKLPAGATLNEAAAAFRTAMFLSGVCLPPRTSRIAAALACSSPPLRSDSLAGASPASAGVTSNTVTLPSLSSATSVAPVVVNSSRPS